MNISCWPKGIPLQKVSNKRYLHFMVNNMKRPYNEIILNSSNNAN